jgi:HK97 family phage major capsid protein
MNETKTPFQLGNKSDRGLLSQVKVDDVNTEARTLTLAFASETPVERQWGNEVLDCSAPAIRMQRLTGGANLLCDHNMRDVVGVVETVSIGSDKVVRAVVRFGKSARADEVFQDVVDGIRRNVSVGYIIHDAELTERSAGVETWRITDWEPFEISLVSVPADTAVGVGRSADNTEQKPPLKKERTMNPEDTVAAKPVIQTPAARNHPAEISAIAANVPGGAELAMRAIQAGQTVEQFQTDMIRHLSTKPVETADIGLSAKETREYSFVRAIRALAAPNERQAQEAAAFEREVSNAVASKMGTTARGLMVPYEVQRRDLNVATASAGGNLVATNLLSGSFIDALRNAMVLSKLGIITLPGLIGKIAIPKQTGSATAYWVTEGNAPTESQQAIGQVTMQMKTIGAFTDFTRDLLMQSSTAVEQLVQNDLAKVVGLGLQQAVINGSGASGQPSGIMTQVTATAGGTNGIAPTWAHVVGLETNVSVANADVGTLGYLTNAKVRGKLKTTERAATTNGQFIWGDAAASPLNGYQTAVTNQIPSNTAKGTGTNLSTLIYGNFADVVLGLWGSLDLTVDPYTFSTTGGVRVVALQSADVALRNVESFAYMSDLITT